METIQGFSWYEYVVFSSMFVATGAIGLYFGCSNKSGINDVREYMFGGGRMPILPIALSLIASYGSGLNLLALPAEIYIYGTQIIVVMISLILATVLLNIFFLPLIYNLNGTSIYEYLELRFNKTVRHIGAFLYLLTMLNTPGIIYPPALAFSQVSGLSLSYIVPVLCAFCIFYTTLGGLKAVAWSDALQSIFIVGAMFTVLIAGILQNGGLANILTIANNGERLEFFNFNLDPTERNTFWTVVIGMTFTWVKFLALDPVSFQRFVSVSSYQQAKTVSWIMCIGVIFVKIICLLSGLIIYAHYHDCDPVITKKVSKPGQILPYYALDIAGSYPGFNGIFLSGVVGTALSALSTRLNTVSGSLLDDVVRQIFPSNISDTTANVIIKTSVIVLGVISGALVFLMERMGNMMQAALSLNGIACGTTVFIYIFGMFYPWGNSKGAISGSLVGIATTLWVAIGAQMAVETGDLQFPGKKLDISGCLNNKTLLETFNYTIPRFITSESSTTLASSTVPYLYRLSYFYYAVIGLVVGMPIAIVVSYFTGHQDLNKLDRNLIVPQMRRFLPKNKHDEKFYIKVSTTNHMDLQDKIENEFSS